MAGARDDAAWAELELLMAGAPVALGDGMREAERAALAAEATADVRELQAASYNLVRGWECEHEYEMWRRREQERYRGTMLVIVRAWREHVDGRRAGGGREWPVRETVRVEMGWEPSPLHAHAFPVCAISAGPSLPPTTSLPAQDSGSFPIEMDVSKMEMGDVIDVYPYEAMRAGGVAPQQAGSPSARRFRACRLAPSRASCSRSS